MDDVILYHGSRGGIVDKIRPDASRDDCDFGKGFYMGESPEQAMGLVVDCEHPVFYKFTFRLSEIPQERILVLDGEDWVNAVLTHRGMCGDFNKLKIARDWITRLQNCDVVIGKIADDRMGMAIQRFADNLLTDKGLIACLQFVNYGNQYVAKTEFACSKIAEIYHRDLERDEICKIREYSSQKRKESRDVVAEMSDKYYGDGKRLKDIIAEQKRLKAKGGEGYDRS